MNRPQGYSAIIYEDADQDTFIIDIPRSIEVAQQLESSLSRRNNDDGGRRRLLSCTPQDAPYPGPSPEPKTATARRRVLERTPASEREFHASITPVISSAMEHVKKHCSPEMCWCFPRPICSTDDGDDDTTTTTTTTTTTMCLEEPRSASRRKRRRSWDALLCTATEQTESSVTSAAAKSDPPPVILAPGVNSFASISCIRDCIVQNPSPHSVALQITTAPSTSIFTVPPKSNFFLGHLLPPLLSLFPATPTFNLIIFDPPWANRSVRRSAHYISTASFDTIHTLIEGLITAHLQYQRDLTGHDPRSVDAGIVGIWTTNAAKARATVHGIFGSVQLEVFEEWIWVKCTSTGEPVLPLDGLWRRPYEVIIWGRARKRGVEDGNPTSVRRRVIFAVPDIHSRKPSLKELVERLFFTETPSVESSQREMEEISHVREYTALEVFARNLTAGWWAYGDEVCRFNHERWWCGRPDGLK